MEVGTAAVAHARSCTAGLQLIDSFPARPPEALATESCARRKQTKRAQERMAARLKTEAGCSQTRHKGRSAAQQQIASTSDGQHRRRPPETHRLRPTLELEVENGETVGGSSINVPRKWPAVSRDATSNW